MSSCIKGQLTWHKDGCIYTGAGIATSGALFSYQANWAAPGRWSVEIITDKHIIFQTNGKVSHTGYRFSCN